MIDDRSFGTESLEAFGRIGLATRDIIDGLQEGSLDLEWTRIRLRHLRGFVADEPYVGLKSATAEDLGEVFLELHRLTANARFTEWGCTAADLELLLQEGREAMVTERLRA